MADETNNTQDNEETATTNTETANEPTNTEQEPTKTFTQDDIDKIVAERIARERKKFADYDDLKAKATEYEKEAEERRLAELSEKERAEELAKKYEDEKTALEKSIEEMKAAFEREKVNNEFIKVATANNIEYIEDAMKLADLSSVTVEEGKVVGVEDVVKSLAESKPFLLAVKKEPKQIGNPSNPSEIGTEKTAEQLLAEAKQRAIESGRPEDRAAYARLKRELDSR